MGLECSTNLRPQTGLLLTVLVPCSLYLVRGSGASHNEPWGKSRHSPCFKLSVPNPTLKSSDTLYNIRLYVTLNNNPYFYQVSGNHVFTDYPTRISLRQSKSLLQGLPSYKLMVNLFKTSSVYFDKYEYIYNYISIIKCLLH